MKSQHGILKNLWDVIRSECTLQNDDSCREEVLWKAYVSQVHSPRKSEHEESAESGSTLNVPSQSLTIATLTPSLELAEHGVQNAHAVSGNHHYAAITKDTVGLSGDLEAYQSRPADPNSEKGAAVKRYIGKMKVQGEDYEALGDAATVGHDYSISSSCSERPLALGDHTYNIQN